MNQTHFTPCPNCGFRHRADGFASGLSRKGLSIRERALLERLVLAKGATVTRAQLVDAMYGDDLDGGPLSAEANVYSYVWRLNRKLASRGFVVAFAGYGVGWFLRPLRLARGGSEVAAVARVAADTGGASA